MLAAFCLAATGLSPLAATAAPQDPSPLPAHEVRTLHTGEWGLPSPRGLAYVPGDKVLLVAGATDTQTPFLRLTAYEDDLGSFTLDTGEPVTASFDARGKRLAMVAGSSLLTVAADQLSRPRPTARRTPLGAVGLRQPAGATFDAAGNLLVLDATARSIVRLDGADPARGVARIPLALGDNGLRGLAFNPADGLLYVGSPRQQVVHAVDGRGRTRATYDLSDGGVTDQQSLVFAPSTDPTDAPTRTHLFVADSGAPDTAARAGARTRLSLAASGTAESTGGVVEMSLTEATAMAEDPVAATLVQTIDTSQWSPPSPDPAGVAWLGDRSRLLVGDSEVEEMPNLFQGVNLYESTVTGALTDTGVTTAFSKEPTGLGYRPSDRTLFVSDDSGNRLMFMVKPGGDGRYGTADDNVTSFTTRPFSEDPEDVAYDTVSGHVFISDGVGREVYRVNPGPDGKFGSSDDVWSNFDVEQYGARDPEGIDHDPARDTLLVVDRRSKAVYEVTKAGALVRIIDISAAQPVGAAGVALAPGSQQPERKNLYIVARGVDNNVDPNENDGKLYEMAVPTSDLPPTVAITSPADGATVRGTVTVQADASDDHGVARVEFFDGTTSLGVDSDGTDGWSIAWDTTATSDGAHTLRAVATDTAGQTASHSVGVTVDNVDSPPSVSITSPADGAAVKGTVTVRADASDDKGVARVEFFVGIVPLGSDSNGSDGWSMPWDTTTTTEGAHTLRAVATDTAAQTASHSVGVTVDNTPPQASVTAPADGATVSLTVTVEAAASDNLQVASVAFHVDGTRFATDTDGANGWSVAWDSTAVANGSHALTAVAVDAAGNATTSAAVGVTVDNPSTFLLTVPVATGTDDVEERSNGRIWTSQSGLDLMTDVSGSGTDAQRAVGLRFLGVSVPRGATILSASVQFQVKSATSVATDLVLTAQAADNAPAFTTKKFDVSSRPRTAAAVAWSPPAWLAKGDRGPAQRTADLSAVLQEVVNRPGWASGNAAVVIVEGTGERVAESFDGLFAPVLQVEYATS